MLKINKKIKKASQKTFCNALVSMVKVYRNYIGMSIGITNFLLVFFHNLRPISSAFLCFSIFYVFFSSLYVYHTSHPLFYTYLILFRCEKAGADCSAPANIHVFLAYLESAGVS